MIRVCLIYLVLVSVSACVRTQIDYDPPTARSIVNTKTINKSREAVWNEAIPALGREFFTINNLDKSSGLINISYSGDPSAYIDCGQVIVKTTRGSELDTKAFPAATQNKTYLFQHDTIKIFTELRMVLDGRVNLIFESLSPNRTLVSAHSKYVVTREMASTLDGKNLGRTKDTVTFNSGNRGVFPTYDNSGQTECVSNGNLERDILSVIQ